MLQSLGWTVCHEQIPSSYILILPYVKNEMTFTTPDGIWIFPCMYKKQISIWLVCCLSQEVLVLLKAPGGLNHDKQKVTIGKNIERLSLFKALHSLLWVNLQTPVCKQVHIQSRQTGRLLSSGFKWGEGRRQEGLIWITSSEKVDPNTVQWRQEMRKRMGVVQVSWWSDTPRSTFHRADVSLTQISTAVISLKENKQDIYSKPW